MYESSQVHAFALNKFNKNAYKYICLTGYVPESFGKIKPIVKGKWGDIDKVTNYRPITIV